MVSGDLGDVHVGLEPPYGDEHILALVPAAGARPRVHLAGAIEQEVEHALEGVLVLRVAPHEVPILRLIGHHGGRGDEEHVPAGGIRRARSVVAELALLGDGPRPGRDGLSKLGGTRRAPGDEVVPVEHGGEGGIEGFDAGSWPVEGPTGLHRAHPGGHELHRLRSELLFARERVHQAEVTNDVAVTAQPIGVGQVRLIRRMPDGGRVSETALDRAWIHTQRGSGVGIECREDRCPGLIAGVDTAADLRYLSGTQEHPRLVGPSACGDHGGS